MTAILREELATGLERIRRAAEADLGKLGDRVQSCPRAPRPPLAAWTPWSGSAA